MLKSALHIFGRNLDYARRLVADLPEEGMAVQPAPGMNHAAWVTGHLAWTCDFGAGLFGLPPQLDASWAQRFDNNSQPVTDRTSYPTKAELMAALESGHARLAAIIQRATPEQLAQPLPYEDFRSAFPTVGDAALHLLTSHEAGHLGQLSAWRRVQSLPPV